MYSRLEKLTLLLLNRLVSDSSLPMPLLSADTSTRLTSRLHFSMQTWMRMCTASRSPTFRNWTRTRCCTCGKPYMAYIKRDVHAWYDTLKPVLEKFRLHCCEIDHGVFFGSWQVLPHPSVEVRLDLFVAAIPYSDFSLTLHSPTSILT